MNVPILDLKRQYELLKSEIEPAVCEVMSSGQYIMGKNVQGFEEKMASYLGVKHTISVGNGTDALIISLQAAGVKANDEVITTPFTFFATAEAISRVGAIPVFVDIEEKTLNLDTEKLEKLITSRTKAILPVHIFGCPAEMNRIVELAEKYHLAVIEDACQAIGAEYHGKKVGAIGDLGCFSFFPTKNLGGAGDGGLISTNDDNLALICRALREHAGGKNGADARAILDGQKTVNTDSTPVDPMYNPYKYYNYLIAYNSRLDAIQAAVLGVKLRHLDEFNAKRAEHAEYYNKHLNPEKFLLSTIPPECHMVWHQYVVRTKKKEQLGVYLSEKGISSAAFYPVPLHLQKAFDDLGYEVGSLPVAEKVCGETVCLPVFPELSPEERQYIVECMNAF